MYFDNDYVHISDLINNANKYLAHIDKERKETLEEHSDLVVKYFLKIFNNKKLENVFINFEEKYFKSKSEEFIKLFRKMIINIFAFHDVGKINPYFQIDKMNNKIDQDQSFSAFGSKHSIISAILYFDYFIKEVSLLDADENKILKNIVFVNSYLISKHHSALGNLDKYLEKFQDSDVDESANDVLDIFKDSKIYKISLSNKNYNKVGKNIKKNIAKDNKNEGIYRYTYMKLVFSLLLASDYYATNEFSKGSVVDDFGNIDDANIIYKEYQNTELYKNIKKYEKNNYKKENIKNKNINSLRSELFLDSESVLMKNIDNNLFFLEAPTGSGKSNTGFNLSFRLIQNIEVNKIFYIYPFNTLVEQNKETLDKIFKNNSKILSNISVVNSVTPIKVSMDETKDDKEMFVEPFFEKKEQKYNDRYSCNIDYSKSLLDRQFLNYPIVLSTHVSLFNIMFNRNKEDSFAFFQLCNSVIVLDEIQSYKNTIWAEIITFLEAFSEILNLKIIIMSATLPDFGEFIDDNNIVKLIKNREKYFNNELFSNRVKIDYSLLKSKEVEDDLINSVIDNSTKNKKILIEFIKKESAYDFYRILKENDTLDCTVDLITGDDNQIERKRIIDEIKSEEVEKHGIILVSTQVIEAGVDIDMDIGYKDISKLDSEEQFMGRINRSCLRDGIVYFFDLDETNNIYRNDVRIRKELTLKEDSIKEILLNKHFDKYYDQVISVIKQEFNNNSNRDNSLKDFFDKDVTMINCRQIENRMRLIDDKMQTITVFMNRTLEVDNESINGSEVWDDYCNLLDDNKMDYSEKRIKMSIVLSRLVLFTYQIMSDNTFTYSDKRGDIFYIENGEQYFEDGKFNKNKLLNGVGDFL